MLIDCLLKTSAGIQANSSEVSVCCAILLTEPVNIKIACIQAFLNILTTGINLISGGIIYMKTEYGGVMVSTGLLKLE